MPLDWRIAGGSTAERCTALVGFDAERRLVAQVVRYDEPPGWVAFSRGRRLAGRWDAQASAQRVAEVHAAHGRRQL